MVGSRTLRIMLLAPCLFPALLFAQAASDPDKSFEDFFQRFIAEQTFRLDRTSNPLRVKIGNPRSGDVRSEKWERKQVRSDLPVPMTAEQLKEKSLDQRVKRHSRTRIEVVQYSPGADTTMLLYTFQISKGHWFLTHFENSSR
jgi:Domain of unknown function (DUF4348)